MEKNHELMEMLNMAKQMGIEYEVDSETPGFFVKFDEKQMKIDPLNLFPELDEDLFHGDIKIGNIDINVKTKIKTNRSAKLSMSSAITFFNKYDISGAA